MSKLSSRSFWFSVWSATTVTLSIILHSPLDSTTYSMLLAIILITIGGNKAIAFKGIKSE